MAASAIHTSEPDTTHLVVPQQCRRHVGHQVEKLWKGDAGHDAEAGVRREWEEVGCGGRRMST